MTAQMIEVERDPVRDLITPELYDQLAQRITRENELPRAVAEQAMDEGLRFLHECAAQPGTHRSPKPVADIGWHTFILHTREYAEFCERVAGHFIHHVPEPDVSAGDCHQCYAGCHDSP